MIKLKMAAVMWRAILALHGNVEMPFNFSMDEKNNKIIIVFINGSERIETNEVQMTQDSIFIKMPVFDSEIRARVFYFETKPVSMIGNFINHARTTDNVIPFKATANGNIRFFGNKNETAKNFSGKWEVHFSQGMPDSSDAIGEFMQSGENITGTFLTPTGDYRYLAGNVYGSTMSLSAFDGCHLFLFKATMKDDGTIEGDYWSGAHWHETWNGRRNAAFTLPDADTLMKLKKGYDGIKFSFLNLDSSKVNFPSEKYKGKVVILQIMGTWCPNCMDESSFLAPFYKTNNKKGLEIIGLAFEKFPEFGRAKKNITRLKTRFNIEYPVLVACTNNKDSIARNLPMLGSIYSYPTTIFIDKKGKVRRIHTGYSGPATGIHYERWENDFTAFVDKLLRE
jgi:thiol-disulfide isomerase/thioredoxin